MKTTYTLLVVVLVAVIAFAGCAKKGPTAGQTQAANVAMMSQVLQIPLPDNSYSVQDTKSIIVGGANMQALAAAVDQFAAGLKETNLHLAQTIAQGQNTNSSLSIVDTALGTSLQGVLDAPHSTVSYTYSIGGVSYFTANVATSGLSGTLTFPARGLMDAFVVTFNVQIPGPGTLVRNVAVNNSKWGNLLFVSIYTTSATIPTKVTMTGPGTVAGSWTPLVGGSFTDSTNAKQCFNAALGDTGC